MRHRYVLTLVIASALIFALAGIAFGGSLWPDSKSGGGVSTQEANLDHWATLLADEWLNQEGVCDLVATGIVIQRYVVHSGESDTEGNSAAGHGGSIQGGGRKSPG